MLIVRAASLHKPQVEGDAPEHGDNDLQRVRAFATSNGMQSVTCVAAQRMILQHGDNHTEHLEC